VRLKIEEKGIILFPYLNLVFVLFKLYNPLVIRLSLLYQRIVIMWKKEIIYYLVYKEYVTKYIKLSLLSRICYLVHKIHVTKYIKIFKPKTNYSATSFFHLQETSQSHNEALSLASSYNESPRNFQEP